MIAFLWFNNDFVKVALTLLASILVDRV
jgi:hypothetical protein